MVIFFFQISHSNPTSYLKDTYREKEHSNKTSGLTKSMNMDIWVVGTSSQFFVRSSYTETKF